MDKKSQFEIFYDGECPLCKQSIGFVRNNDKIKKFSFLPLENSEKPFMNSHGYPLINPPDTLVLKDENKMHIKSSAILKIFKELGFPWCLLYAFIIVPRPLRDLIYDIIAKNRKRIPGKS